MTTSIGVGSSAILVLEDSQEGGGGDGRKAVGGVVAPRSLATFRLRLRPSDEDEDDDERTANTQKRRPAAGSGRWRRTKEKRRSKRRRQRGGGRERRLLKVGGKFGSAAKLTQLSSPLLKRNFASPDALLLLQPSTRCAAPLLPPSIPPPSPSRASSRAVSIRHSGRLSEGVNSVFWDYRFCRCHFFLFFFIAHATSGAIGSAPHRGDNKQGTTAAIPSQTHRREIKRVGGKKSH